MKRFACVLLLFWLVICSPLLADTHRWVGGALATTDEYTITIAGTYVPSASTITLTDGNGHDVVLTVGSTVTVEEIASAVCSTINASTVNGNLSGDETRTGGCQSLPEWTDMSASVAGAVVTVKAKRPGMPVVFSVSEDAAAGTAVKATVITATGPNHFDNADNWDVGALPVGSDIVRFDSGNAICIYGVDYLTANTIDCSVFITTDYTGQIGLPLTNPAGYREYRVRNLGIFQESLVFVAGTEGRGGCRCWCEGNVADEFRVHDGGSASGNIPRIVLAGGAWNSIEVTKGFVQIQSSTDPTATAISCIDYDFGGVGLGKKKTKVIIGDGLDFGNGDEIRQYSGTVICRESLYADPTNNAVLEVNGGEFILDDAENAGAWDCTIKRGGSFSWVSSGDTGGTWTINSGGSLDMSQSRSNHTFTGPLYVHAGATIKLGGNSPTITYVGCEEDDVKIIP